MYDCNASSLNFVVPSTRYNVPVPWYMIGSPHDRSRIPRHNNASQKHKCAYLYRRLVIKSWIMEDGKRYATNIDEGSCNSKTESTTRPTKRARFQVETAHAPNFLPTCSNKRGRRFLLLHLQLLKAIYSQDNRDSNDITGGKRLETETMRTRGNYDRPLHDDLCTSIEAFLRDRGRARSLDVTVQHYQELYEGALQFIDEQHGKEDSNRAAIPVSTWSLVTQKGNNGRARNFPYTNPMIRSALLLGGSQQSPFAPSSHIYPRTLLSSHFLEQSAPGATGDHISVNPFGLVAGIIQAKHKNALEDLQKTILPFEPLVDEVTQRIQSLEMSLIGQQSYPNSRVKKGANITVHRFEDNSNSDSFQNGHTSDEIVCGSYGDDVELEQDEEEWRARTETKLRLWRLLEMDLKNQI